MDSFIQIVWKPTIHFIQILSCCFSIVITNLESSSSSSSFPGNLLCHSRKTEHILFHRNLFGKLILYKLWNIFEVKWVVSHLKTVQGQGKAHIASIYKLYSTQAQLQVLHPCSPVTACSFELWSNSPGNEKGVVRLTHIAACNRWHSASQRMSKAMHACRPSINKILFPHKQNISLCKDV